VGRYLAQKILASIGMLLGIAIVTFTILALAPGDPAQILSQEGATQEQIDHLRQQLGLDQPLPVQFALFLRYAVVGDFGESIFTHEPVRKMIFDRFPLTFTLALGGIIWASIVAIPIGTLAAVRRGSFTDFAVIGMSLFGVSTPVFWRGLVLILLFAIWVPLFPISGIAPADSGPVTSMKYFILPWFSLGLTSLGVIARVVRASVLEQLGQDYATTARAKGLHEQAVLYRHILRNALIPIITVIGLQLVGLLSGAALTEMVFGLPGIGQMVVTAISRRDYAVVQGTLLFIGFIFVVVHLVIDALYAVVNPRIRYT
jgi:peptide/nickel transport system permease protein